MAKLLAIEWDDREARVAVGSPRGSEMVVEDAFAIDITAAVAEAADDDLRAVGQRIAEVLAQRGLTGSDALVGLGRTSIELRSLSLPPVPPEEVPDLVRFQAIQAFTTIGEDWPLDYVELGSQDESINVLAAVVAPKQVEQILQVCAASQLTPRCLVLRAFAAASLLNRSGVLAAGRNALIIDLLADGADLTAIFQGQVVFMRTVRTPASDDPAVLARFLVGEARRTVGAAQAQMAGQRIEQVVICGNPAEHPVLAESLSESLTLDVVVYDPFKAVPLARTLEQHLPADSGRYAPLLGVLADEAAGVRHAIDFLNPRKRPKPRSNRQRNLLIAAGSAAVIGVVALAVWLGLRHLDGKIRDLQAEANALNKEVEQAEKLVARANAVKEFTDKDVTWLDEIRELARRIPDADNVLLKEVQFQTDVKRGAVMMLRGNVKNPGVIEHFEDSLRYGDNVVAGRYGTKDRKQTEYPYNLDTSVVLTPDKYDGGRPKGRPIREQMRTDTVQPPPPVKPKESEKAPAAASAAKTDSATPAAADGTPKSEPATTPAAADGAAKPEPATAPAAADATPKPEPATAPAAADATPKPEPATTPAAADATPKPEPATAPPAADGPAKPDASGVPTTEPAPTPPAAPASPPAEKSGPEPEAAKGEPSQTDSESSQGDDQPTQATGSDN